MAFAAVRTPVGEMLVAVTEDGVAAVDFRDSAQARDRMAVPPMPPALAGAAVTNGSGSASVTESFAYLVRDRAGRRSACCRTR